MQIKPYHYIPEELKQMPSERKYFAPAVQSAARIFKYLSRYSHSHATLTEISNALAISTATCLRILHTLVEESLLNYEPDTRKYSLGPYLIIFGSRAADQLDYISIARKYLKKAAELTGNTCVLDQVLERDSITYIAKEEVLNPIGISVAIGQRYPITAGSHGKCFLAFLPEDEAREIIRRVGLPRFTPNSITEEDLYIDELHEVRLKGYATSLEEHYLGINGVAAPIFDHLGKVILCITCIGTSMSLKDEHMVFCGETLKNITSEVTLKISGGSYKLREEDIDVS